MLIRRLQLQSFRRFADAELHPQPGFNLITGDNGSGKTSLLEALHLLAHGRSFRGRVRDGLIRREDPSLSVYAEWQAGSDTAHRAGGNCSQIFRYAIATGRADRDPVPDLRGALPPARGGNFAAITEPAKVAELLRAIDAFSGTFVVKSALLLSPLLFVRPGELRRAEWAGFDLEKAEWGYFVTKTKSDHLVPLASQAVAILKELHALTGHGRYVFPGRDPQKAMSEAAVNAALRRMGYDTKTEITGHGFRAMARTILHEELHQKPEVIEHQLAHKVPDSLGTAYNRTKFLKERKAMMQLWADYLDKLKAGAEVIPLHGSAA